MNGAEVLTKFTADTSGLDKATKNASSNLTGLTKSIALGNIAASVINKTLSTMSSNLDSAITRYDTMNNFPRVMNNLGISGEEASEVINDLSERLTGLPTSLDAGARAVQRFTAVNGNIKESENLFLAVNNAILAGGASADIQASALEQISQAYSKGKPDMMEWRTLMMAMPAQLKQVSQALGYETVDAMGEAVRSADGGKEAFNEMMNTIVELNATGTGEFASFEKQARDATGGVGTAIKNMRTATTRGIAKMIEKINEALEPYGGLSGVISGVGTIAEQVFTKIGDLMAFIIPKISQIVSWFQQYGFILTPLIAIVGSLVVALKTYSVIMGVINTLQTIQNALMLANPAVLIIAGIVAAITVVIGIIVLLYNKCEWFRNLVGAIFDFIKIGIGVITTVIQTIIDFIVNVVTGLWNFLQPIFDFIKNAIIAYIAIVATVWSGIWNILKGIANWVWDNILSPIINFFKNAFNTVWGIVSPIIDRIKNAFSIMINGVKSGFNALKSFLGNIFGAIGGVVKAPVNGVISGINKVLDKINGLKIPDWVPGLGGKSPNFKKIPALATGTNYVPEDTLAMIHKGEAVVPKKFNPYAGGLDNATLGSMNATKPSMTIIVNADFETDPLGQVVQKIKTFSGGAKNDYNYGMGGSRY